MNFDDKMFARSKVSAHCAIWYPWIKLCEISQSPIFYLKSKNIAVCCSRSHHALFFPRLLTKLREKAPCANSEEVRSGINNKNLFNTVSNGNLVKSQKRTLNVMYAIMKPKLRQACLGKTLKLRARN